jgi:predicted TIM-barrel fold metal-dependent hydrolase
MNEKMFVIDLHNHFYPPETAQLARDVDGTDFASKIKNRPSGFYNKTHDLDQRLQMMDGAGVDMAVLNQAAWSPQGLEMCRAINDGYAEAGKTHPDRFIPCTHIPPEASPEVLAELDRGVNELGMKALALVSSTSKTRLDSENLFPLYEKVSQYGIPIVIHPTLRKGLWGGEKYRMEEHVSREYDVAKATVEVMYGVLPQFPDLKFVMPHHGGGIPALKGRIVAHFEPEGWDVPDEIRRRPKTPSELDETGLNAAFEDLFGKLYFDTAGFGGWLPITEAAAKTIRNDRLLFGTDYPFEIHRARDVKVFVEGIKNLDITDQAKRNILGENAKRLFGIQ